MLMGEYNYTIDDKGRLNFPAKFREKMGAEFVVTRWLDGCLVAFPEGEWQRITDILRSKSMVKTRDIQRFRGCKRKSRSSAWAATPRSGTPQPGRRSRPASPGPTSRRPWKNWTFDF